jgi:hypothetical protein
VGGVTNGEWTCYAEGIELIKPAISLVKRSLKHILRTTEGRSSARSLKKVKLRGLEPEDRLKWQCDSVLVLAHLVFEHGDVVERKLVFGEWMDAYDLEITVQEALSGIHKTMKRGTMPLSFVEQIPVKVLRELGIQVILKINNTGDTCCDGSWIVTRQYGERTRVWSCSVKMQLKAMLILRQWMMVR